MKSEETKGIVQQWFVPVALIIVFLLTYNDIISGISAKLNVRQVQEENKIKNYNFENDIQGPIEQAKDAKELKKVCADNVENALNQAKYLTEELNKENAIHDEKWRVQTESRWRTNMLEHLEEATVASIEVAWKTDELCRLEEYIAHDQKTASAIAKFQALVVERGLKESHLRKFQSQLRIGLEEAVENFNDWNEKRLMHLASYAFDVTYARSPIDWVTKGPIGVTFKSYFGGVTDVYDTVKEQVEDMSEVVQDTIVEAKEMASENTERAKVALEKPKVAPVPAAPQQAQQAAAPNPQAQPARTYPETQATRTYFPGE